MRSGVVQEASASKTTAVKMAQKQSCITYFHFTVLRLLVALVARYAMDLWSDSDASLIAAQDSG